MFSYANILFAKLLMVTCLSTKSCLKEWSDEKKIFLNFSYLIELTKIYKSVLFIFFKTYFFLAKI